MDGHLYQMHAHHVWISALHSWILCWHSLHLGWSFVKGLLLSVIICLQGRQVKGWEGLETMLNIGNLRDTELEGVYLNERYSRELKFITIPLHTNIDTTHTHTHTFLHVYVCAPFLESWSFPNALSEYVNLHGILFLQCSPMTLCGLPKLNSDSGKTTQLVKCLLHQHEALG